MLLHHFLEASAARLPHKVALVQGSRRFTYLEVDGAADRLAQSLLKAGIQRGDRVAIHLENSFEAVVGLFATLKMGGVFMMLNPSLKTDKLAYVLRDAGAAAFFVDERKRRALDESLRGADTLRLVVSVGGASTRSDHAPRVADWAEVLAPRDTGARTPGGAIPTDLAALIYTSGSTGRPKGVMLSHQNMVAASTSITTYLENVEDDVILNVLPLAFDYGLYQVLMAFQRGARVVLERGFTFPHAVLQRAVEEGVTGLPLVPTLASMLLELDLDRYDLASLRYLTNTAAALPVSHITRLRARLPHARLYSMYGLTECKRALYLPPEELDRRPGSVGKAIPFTEAFVVDEWGERAPTGQVGELVVRGPHVMLGYWGQPAASAKRLRAGPLPREAFLHTGDLFRTDEEGFFYFVGRKDDVIKSRGEKVPPREVEEALYALEGVRQVAVLGEAHPLLGQAVVAFVSLQPGATLTERDLLRQCSTRLEDFMVPTRVELRPELPVNASGKIDKLVLAAMSGRESHPLEEGA